MAFDPRSEDLFHWLSQVCAKSANSDIENFHLISGDASFRRYFRLTIDNKSYIAVDAPPETEDNALFISLAKALKNQNLLAPQVLDANLDQGFMLQSDLGSTMLSDKLSADNVETLYTQALDLLPKMQKVTGSELGSLPGYDAELVKKELGIFSEWLIDNHLNLALSTQEQSVLSQTFAYLAEAFDQQPKAGVHRDYHSRNLMLLKKETESITYDIAIIDFQGGLVGPITYDVVSLLRDCYIAWPKDLVQNLSETHRAKYHSDIPPQQWQHWFDLTGMQRHLKAAGIFARLHHRDGKSHYLADIPRTLNYVVDVCEKNSQLSDFHQLLINKILPSLKQKSNNKEEA